MKDAATKRTQEVNESKGTGAFVGRSCRRVLHAERAPVPSLRLGEEGMGAMVGQVDETEAETTFGIKILTFFDIRAQFCAFNASKASFNATWPTLSV